MTTVTTETLDVPLELIRGLGYSDSDSIQLASKRGESWSEYQQGRAVTVTEFPKFWTQASNDSDCYFRVQPAKPDAVSRKGYSWSRIAAFGLDLDFKADAVIDEGNAWVLIRHIAVFTDFGAPDLIVNTGHGLHVYWLADDDLNDAPRAMLALKRFDAYLLELAKSEYGWAFDNVADPARVLRLPGSRNWKDATDAPLVRLVPVPTDLPRRDAPVALSAVLALTEGITVRGSGPRGNESVVLPLAEWAGNDPTLPADYHCNWLKGRGGRKPVPNLKQRYEKDLRLVKRDRHKRAYSWACRITGCYRSGCLSYGAYVTHRREFNEFFTKLVSDRAEGLHQNELEGFWRDAQATIELKSDEELIAEDVQHENCDNLDPVGATMNSKEGQFNLDEHLNEYGYPGTTEDLPDEIKFQVWFMKLMNVDDMEEGVAKLVGVMVIAGLGSVGKSSLALWIMCRLTRGELLGHWYGKPQYVVIFTREDSLSEVILAKIRRMNGDPSKFKTYKAPDGKRFNIEEYTKYIRAIMCDPRYDFAFGLIEAASMNLYGPGSKKEKDVGDLLLKLSEELESIFKTVALLLPVNKATGTFDMIIKTIMGESAWVNNVRLVLLVAYQNNDKVEVTDPRYLAPIKTNNGESQKMRHFQFEVDYVLDRNNKRIPNPDDPKEYLKSVDVKWLPELDRNGATAQAKHFQERAAASSGNGNGKSTKADKDADLLETIKDCAQELHLVNEKLLGDSSGLLFAEPLFLAINEIHADFWTNVDDPQAAKRKIERRFVKLSKTETPFEFVANSKPLKLQLTQAFMHSIRPMSELGKTLHKSI